METARIRSVKAAAAGIVPPPNLADQENLVVGTEHFAMHCAECHGAPGVPRGEIAEGLYPKPPNLTNVAQRYTPGELFWVVKNGIKMSGMPAWNDHTDAELWATVAFLRKLSGMSEADYDKLVKESMALGGHHHGATEEDQPDAMPGMDHSAMPGMAPTPTVSGGPRH